MSQTNQLQKQFLPIYEANQQERCEFIITSDTCKSLEDFCQKLLLQYQYILNEIQGRSSFEANMRAHLDLYESQMQELYDSHLHEQQLQEQIHEATLKDAVYQYQEQVVKLQELSTSQKINYEQMIQNLNKQMQDLNSFSCKKCSNLKISLSSFEKDANQKLREKEQSIVQSNNDKLKLEKELQLAKDQIESLKMQVEHVLCAKKSNQDKFYQQENTNTLYNASQKNLTDRTNEIQELKLQIQNQIKENLAIEIQKNEEKEASKKKLDVQQNKINDLESQLIEMQSKSQEQKQKLDQFNSQRQKELINQFTEQNQALIKQLQEADVSFQNLTKKLQLANESNRAMEKQQSWQKLEIEGYHEQTEKLRVDNLRLADREVSLSKHLQELKSKNEELNQTIIRSQHEIQWLEGLDVHVVLQKPQGGYGTSALDNTAGSTGLDMKHRRSPFNKSLGGGPSIHDHLEEFISKQPTVNSYAQSVGQARLIEKFISADLEQKKELKLLKKKFTEIEKSFSEKYSDWTQTVQRIQEEKSSLEKLILEILSFGEQCDKQFDQLQENLTAFENSDRADAEKYQKIYHRIKKSLQESVKNLIVDIEDNQHRDKFLGTLTQLNQKNLELDCALAQIIEDLVQKAKDDQKIHKENETLTKNVQALQENYQALESDFNQQQTKSQSLKQLNQVAKDSLLELNSLVQGISKNMEVAEQLLLLGEKRLKQQRHETKQAATSLHDLEKKSIEQIKELLLRDLRLIYDWSHEQQHQTQMNQKDRERIVQLNLQVNDLTKANSLLNIEVEKQKMINQKYIEQFPRLKSPLRQRSADEHLETQSKENLLHNILNKVQHLRDESDPKKLFGKFKTKHLDKNTFSDMAFSRQHINFTEATQIIEERTPSLSRDEESKGSSYYDLRGSVDLVNQSRVEKISAKYKVNPNDQEQEPSTHKKTTSSVQNSEVKMKELEQHQKQVKRPATSQFVQNPPVLYSLHHTCKEDQLESYRRSARSREGDLQRTSQFMPAFAQTQQNLETARESENVIQPIRSNRGAHLPSHFKEQRRVQNPAQRAKIPDGHSRTPAFYGQASLKCIKQSSALLDSQDEFSQGGPVQISPSKEVIEHYPLQMRQVQSVVQKKKTKNMKQAVSQPQFANLHYNKPTRHNFSQAYEADQIQGAQSELFQRSRKISPQSNSETTSAWDERPASDAQNHSQPSQKHYVLLPQDVADTSRSNQVSHETLHTRRGKEITGQKSRQVAVRPQSQFSGAQNENFESFNTENLQRNQIKNNKLDQINQLLKNQEYLLQLAERVQYEELSERESPIKKNPVPQRNNIFTERQSPASSKMVQMSNNQICFKSSQTSRQKLRKHLSKQKYNEGEVEPSSTIEPSYVNTYRNYEDPQTEQNARRGVEETFALPQSYLAGNSMICGPYSRQTGVVQHFNASVLRKQPATIIFQENADKLFASQPQRVLAPQERFERQYGRRPKALQIVNGNQPLTKPLNKNSSQQPVFAPVLQSTRENQQRYVEQFYSGQAFEEPRYLPPMPLDAPKLNRNQAASQQHMNLHFHSKAQESLQQQTIPEEDEEQELIDEEDLEYGDEVFDYDENKADSGNRLLLADDEIQSISIANNRAPLPTLRSNYAQQYQNNQKLVHAPQEEYESQYYFGNQDEMFQHQDRVIQFSQIHDEDEAPQNSPQELYYDQMEEDQSFMIDQPSYQADSQEAYQPHRHQPLNHDFQEQQIYRVQYQYPANQYTQDGYIYQDQQEYHFYKQHDDSESEFCQQKQDPSFQNQKMVTNQHFYKQ